MSKFIREGRMGPPKSFKTGAVAGTYPKPMLYLQFDREGLSVVPSKGKEPSTNELRMDVTYDEVVTIRPGTTDLGVWLAKPPTEQPKILCVDFTQGQTLDIELVFKPPAMSQPFLNFMSAYNLICSHIRGGGSLPWKTAVFDSVTGYEDVLLNHISMANPSAMSDARQWAGQVGGKVRQTILSMTTWPCHVVFIMHSMIEKNETTGTVTELPSVFSSLRTDIGGLFSQFFYAVKDMSGKPRLWPHDKMYVRGVGARWPSGLPGELDPDFKSIYGKEGLA